MLKQSNSNMVRIVALAVAAAASLVFAQVRTIPVTDESTQAITGPGTEVTMQAKLNHSQKVLEGLVVHDFAAIEKAAAALSQISLTPAPDLAVAGDKSDRQIYEHFRMEFARLSGQLESHARRKELAATAYVHQNLTATCIACHEYIRDYSK